MLLDIVILPPQNIRKRFSAIAKKADDVCKSDILIDNKKLIPHCSIFHINTSAARLSKLYKAIQSLTSLHLTTTLQTNGYHDSELGWLDFQLTGYRSLKKLRTNIIKVCAPLRTGMMPPWRHRNLTSQEKSYRRKYGVSYSPKTYSPHLTIGKFNTKCIKKIKELLKTEQLSFKVDNITICRVNKYWQVTKILKQFKV